MTPTDLLKVIAENFLCVRRIPFETTQYWTYREGDENRKASYPCKREVITQDFGLSHFEKTKPLRGETRSPEERYAEWKKRFPFGRKLMKETRTVNKGGWWYVLANSGTSSTIQFSNKHNDFEFSAPTLEEAIQLFLKSKV